MILTNEIKIWFGRNLNEWFDQNLRPLPWKGERDPYLIWLSEIILQQTRVEQGLPYFERFRAAYPTVEALAHAPEADVFKLWEGLGYYSRARNLHATAKQIADEMNGIFPKTYDEILKLKGVGAYTSAAISSFAYNLPHAVVDGNVFRVLSRIFGIETPIDTTEGKKQFTQIANFLLEKENPARHNQAMMDFGATHCKPVAPRCASCPFQSNCQAILLGKVEKLPIKSKKLEKRTRFFYFLIFKNGEKTWIRERTERDIWQNLFEFPLLETEKSVQNWQDLRENALDTGGGHFLEKNQDLKPDWSGEIRQQLTHQTIVGRFLDIEIDDQTAKNWQLDHHFQGVSISEIRNFAFPKIINSYLENSTKK